MASHEPGPQIPGHDAVRRPSPSIASTNTRGHEGARTAPDQTEGMAGENSPPRQSDSAHSYVLQGFASRDPGYDPETAQTVQSPTDHKVDPKIHSGTGSLMQGRMGSSIPVPTEFKRRDPIDLDDYFVGPRHFIGGLLGNMKYPEEIRSLFSSIALHKDEKLVILRISALYRAELHRLQFELAKDTMEFALVQKDQRGSQNGLDDRTEKLNAYVQALKNWKYVQAAVHTWERDPFVINTKDIVGVEILLKLFEDVDYGTEYEEDLRKLKETVENIKKNGKVREQEIKLAFDISRKERYRKHKVRGFLNRLLMAVVGGAFLICPVTIMAYNQALWVTLLTTGLFVVALGVFLAAWQDNEFNVLAGAAAYTAVLMVFVGLSAEKS